jgi:hypothetical protein
MPVHQRFAPAWSRVFAREQALSAALLAVLSCAVSACDPGEDDPGFSTLDGAVTVGDSGLPGPDATTTGVPGGGTTGGGTTGAGSLDAGTTGGTQGGTAGGGFEAGAPDAGRDAGQSRDAAVADTGVSVPVGDGGTMDYEAVRQVCLDTINMYRATMSLPPFKRGSAAQEACGDEGAKYDGDINRGKPANQVVGHLSTMNRSAACKAVGFGAQNACPNWGVGARTGNATLADAIKGCLKQMWAEGEPPGGVQACKDAYFKGDTACFLAHGHYINMIDTATKTVSCGFYNVTGGTYWMNQDFAGR